MRRLIGSAAILAASAGAAAGQEAGSVFECLIGSRCTVAGDCADGDGAFEIIALSQGAREEDGPMVLFKTGGRVIRLQPTPDESVFVWGARGRTNALVLAPENQFVWTHVAASAAAGPRTEIVTGACSEAG